MAENFRVTIVAIGPNGEEDDLSKETLKQLSSVKRPPQIRRAANVEQLSIELEEAWNDSARKPDQLLEVQLVGHATSGLLHLGSSWMGDVLPPAAFQDPFFLVDTNPWSLMFLGEFRGKIAKLVLNGCRVGASDAEGYAINGRTLAYTFCELLQTKVIAAADFTEPGELDDDGEYKPNATHLQPISWTWRPNAEPLYANPNTKQPVLKRAQGATERIRIEHVRALVPAHMRNHDAAISLDLAITPIDAPHLRFAAAELLVAVGGNNVAAITGNGRVLRRGAELFAIENDAEARRVLGAALAKRPS